MNYPGYEAIAELLVVRSGLSFPPSRRDGAERGIRRAMERAGVRAPDQYRGLLERDPNAFDDLMIELTVGETYFFREPAQFEFIRRQILPEIRLRRGDDHDLRAWSAACASGEEPYSLAVLLEEGGQAGRAHVLGTDISRAALAKARRAEYTAWSLRGEGAKGMRPYLRKVGDGWQIADTIRRHVRFEYLNLALDVYPSLATGTWGMDLILCRNVLIYFDRETNHQIAQRLFASLAPGGWLITASSDPPLGADAPFESVVTDVGVFYRRFGEPVQAKISNLEQGISNLEGDVLSFDIGNSWFDIRNPSGSLAHEVTAAPNKKPAGLRSAIRKLKSEITGDDFVAEAKSALDRGDYPLATDMTRGHLDKLAANVIYVRALANRDVAAAEKACGEATIRHPLSEELHYLHAVMLLSLGRENEAALAVRRVIYLDRSLALAHFTLGSILRRRGDKNGARRAYRNARELCAAVAADQALPLGEGEQAGQLATAAAAELAVLEKEAMTLGEA